jgi:broad-specificity NMP kinase
MRLILVSGLSGSGKSVALHMLEDAGFYCVDNIPAALLKPFISHTLRNNNAQYSRAAVGVDARNAAAEIETVPPLIEELKKSGIQCEILFLLANEDELLRRFAETRRKHPISTDHVSLKEAIAIERRLLEPILHAADLVIDTSRMGVHDLRELVSQRVEKRATARLSLLVESFGPRSGRHPVPRIAEGCAPVGGGHPAIREAAHPGTSGGQPPIPEHRRRLHGRATSIGVPRGAHRRATRAGLSGDLDPSQFAGRNTFDQQRADARRGSDGLSFGFRNARATRARSHRA